MGESAGKPRKRYVDILKIESKTCCIHGLGHSYDKCKVLGDFGTKYDKSKPNKDHGNYPIPIFFNMQLENNPIINDVVDRIILNETQKVSSAREAQVFLGSDYDADDLYKVEKMILEEIKEILEWRKCEFECELKNSYGIEK